MGRLVNDKRVNSIDPGFGQSTLCSFGGCEVLVGPFWVDLVFVWSLHKKFCFPLPSPPQSLDVLHISSITQTERLLISTVPPPPSRIPGFFYNQGGRVVLFSGFGTAKCRFSGLGKKKKKKYKSGFREKIFFGGVVVTPPTPHIRKNQLLKTLKHSLLLSGRTPCWPLGFLPYRGPGHSAPRERQERKM